MNFKEPKAIYLQIADRIMGDIIGGYYTEEERIPSVREYATMVEVNANTVMRSYEYLQQMGAIYNRRGIGYFVAQGARELVIRNSREAFEQQDLPDFFATLQRLKINFSEIADKYEQYLSIHPSK